MSDLAIRVENISKRYRIGLKDQVHDTFMGALTDFIRQPAKNLRNLRKLTSFADATDEADDVIWALRDISFEQKIGEVIGVIGNNGSGKSTLLKVLSRITQPTSGRAVIRGRVAALLEVGTGFHPELTGRENVYLNGSILGMTKREIDRKFDEILSFAEVEKFIDTPVKRYSSGMRVRLAFSVAAHLEPEILLVDEVLAVGDMTFQRKCLGKMDDVTSEGRTVIFVSHNMGAVSRLCHRGVFLDAGRIVSIGSIDRVVEEYTSHVLDKGTDFSFIQNVEKPVQFTRLRIMNEQEQVSARINRLESVMVEIEYIVRKEIDGAIVKMMLDGLDGTLICRSNDVDWEPGHHIARKPGIYRSVITLPGGVLNAGAFQIRMLINKEGGLVYDRQGPFYFDLSDAGTFAALGDARGRARPGVIAPEIIRWETEQIANVKGIQNGDITNRDPH